MYMCVYVYIYMEKFPYISMVKFKISLVGNRCLPFRSSRSQRFFKVVVPKNDAGFVEKHLCWSLFLIKFSPSGLQLY